VVEVVVAGGGELIGCTMHEQGPPQCSFFPWMALVVRGCARLDSVRWSISRRMDGQAGGGRAGSSDGHG
jgi:hypothetical protein